MQPSNASSGFAPARPIASKADADALFSHFSDVLEALLALVERETALVRAGKLKDASLLEQSKADLARLYRADAEQLKVSRDYLRRTFPDAVQVLERRHDSFRAVLQINLTVLATAHAVSEGLIRGVAGEMTRKAAPSTYGASGRTTAPPRSAAQPVTLSRTL